jgi:hypothetical protein
MITYTVQMLSKYVVSRVWEFCGGEGPHGTVRAPPDLLDERGVKFPLGVWPQAPLDVMAQNLEDAVDQAISRWQQDRVMYRHTKVSEERFDELMATPRLGYPHYTQVIEEWVVKLADAPADAAWFYGGCENFTPRAPGADPVTT